MLGDVGDETTGGEAEFEPGFKYGLNRHKRWHREEPEKELEDMAEARSEEEEESLRENREQVVRRQSSNSGGKKEH